MTQVEALALVVLCLFAMFAVELIYQERVQRQSDRPRPNERRK